MSTRRHKRKRKHVGDAKSSSKRRKLNNNGIHTVNIADNAPEIYCVCRQPCNDEAMVQCSDCWEWFHFSCIGMDVKEVVSPDEFNCPICGIQKKNDRNTNNDEKVKPKLRENKKQKKKIKHKTKAISTDNMVEKEDDIETAAQSTNGTNETVNKLKKIQKSLQSLHNTYDDNIDILPEAEPEPQEDTIADAMVRSLEQRLLGQTQKINDLKQKNNAYKQQVSISLEGNRIKIIELQNMLLECEKNDLLKTNQAQIKDNKLQQHCTKISELENSLIDKCNLLQEKEAKIKELERVLIDKENVFQENEIKINEFKFKLDNVLQEKDANIKKLESNLRHNEDLLKEKDIKIKEVLNSLIEKDILLGENEQNHHAKIEEYKNIIIEKDKLLKLKKRFDSQNTDDTVNTEELMNGLNDSNMSICTINNNSIIEIESANDTNNTAQLRNNSNTNNNNESPASENEWWQCEQCCLEYEPEVTVCTNCNTQNTQI